MGGTPIATVAADVSGRVPGDKEVLSFVRTILSQFDGLVQDDYSANVWSLADIERNVLKDGHPFFDYRGWHESDLDGWTVLS
jgi:hypothetical protein